ncbi:MAG: HAD hydrolase family protein [Armatimonadetes bacterium]|nr:HAD hydrolase family protein [Armatimonadota bacterium]
MTPQLSAGIIERIHKVRCLVLDVDGVLTDGRLVYYPDGAVAPTGFHVQDGMGIHAALEAGLKVVLISGNWTDAVRLRAEHLRVSAHHLGVGNKMVPLAEVSQQFEIPWSEFAYVGDDLNDPAPMRSVGFCATVPNAAPEVLDQAHYITKRQGGFGAVREIIELILRQQGRWEHVVAGFLPDIEVEGFSVVNG